MNPGDKCNDLKHYPDMMNSKTQGRMEQSLENSPFISHAEKNVLVLALLNKCSQRLILMLNLKNLKFSWAAESLCTI